MSAAPRAQASGGQNPEFILREFGGVNNVAGREAIGDNELYWLENLMPIAGAAAYPVPAPSPALATIPEVGAPTYTLNFSIESSDYVFAVWANSGNGWIVNLQLFTNSMIITGLTSGQTSATQYNNQGILIIDPTGYWDFNITTPSVVTSQLNAIASANLVSASAVAGGTSLKQTLSVSGTGGALQALYMVSAASLTAGGSGYSVGDTLLLSDGSPTTPASLIVATIDGSGAVLTFTIEDGGSYPGPTSSTPVATGPTGSVITGGSGGTGATFSVRIIATGVNVISRGHGYSAADTMKDFSGTTLIDSWKIVPSGVVGGTQIATYAGRVWIATARTVSFTDINSYYSFGGAGGSFTITDAYLHNNITVLYAANNYLYIMGDTSIDALSNVNVVQGVTQFTRLNVTTSVGSTIPTSVFAYYRGLAFANGSGFYLLTGATPDKVSEKISGVIKQIDFTQTIFGCQVVVYGELCAAMLFEFLDTFTVPAPGVTRALMALFFRGRWWFLSLGNLSAGAIFSIPVGGLQTLYAWAGNSLYTALDPIQGLSNWILKTKLWDGGAPFREKQSINVAIGALFNGEATPGISVTVDTEYGSQPPVTDSFPGVQWVNVMGQAVTWQNESGQTVDWTIAPNGYWLFMSKVESGSSQYVGLTLNGTGGNTSRLDILGLRAKQDHNYLT